MRRLLLLLALLALGGPGAESFCHTFSIVARDPDTGMFAVAVSTMPDSVGNVVPWAKFGVGAIATQARVNGGFGPRGLKLLEEGKTARETLDALLEDDAQRDERQLAVVDNAGNVAAFTGEKCMEWAGDLQGDQFSVQGNILVDEKTVAAMKEAFEKKEGDFAERVLRALEAGRAAGGDRRGHSSAAILVVSDKAEEWYGEGYDRLVDLRVDHHDEPVLELRRIYNRRFNNRRTRLGDRLLARPRGADVAELCRLLAAKGYYDGDIVRVYSDAVADAVRRFKKERGMAEDDVVDGAVVEALRQEEQLSAGAASRDITPSVEPWDDADGDGRRDKDESFEDKNGNGEWDPVWLAGFSPGRSAVSVHDPLTAQALVVGAGGTRAAIVALDLIGLLFRDVGDIRREAAKATGIPESNIVVCSTHNHNSPDTLGIWGALPGFSGRDADYFTMMKARAVEAVVEANEKLAPARMRYAEAEVAGLIGDSREPKVMNEVGRALLFENADGKAVAAFVDFACHPEARGSKNREVTSDYPHYVREAMVEKYGAPCVFAVGDIGGLIAPRVGHEWEGCERMGRTIAEKLGAALDAAEPRAVGTLKVASRRVTFAMENKMFQRAAKAGNFGPIDGYIEEGAEGAFTIPTELTAIRLGDVVIVTVPGEIFPELAREIYDAIEAPHKIMIGLGNDELGYIIPEKAWDPKDYEESMSIGPKTGTVVVEEARALLKGF